MQSQIQKQPSTSPIQTNLSMSATSISQPSTPANQEVEQAAQQTTALQSTINQSQSSATSVLLQGSMMSLTASNSYKPFISEKELIQTIIAQEGEITNTMKLFWDMIPRNFRLYKEYGDRLMNNGERMRLQLSPPTPDCKDLFTLLFQLGQFFEIIGRLFSQNFNNVSLEMADPLNDAIQTLRNHKDANLAEHALKVLPKAQQLHSQGEKQKAEYERLTREAQEAVQRMKNSKNDPNLIYNISEQAAIEDKATRAVKEMEDKKAKYKGTLEQLEQRNQQFIHALERINKDHQGLVDYSAGTIKQFLERCVGTELNHYENLNLITPEKAQVIKNFVIRQDLNSDIKLADELNLKIDLQFAKQKLADLPEGSTTHQSITPFSQYITDANRFYTGIADKWSKHFQTMQQFLTELNLTEKQMVKAYKEMAASEKKRPDSTFGAFQGPAYEFLRTIETKEKNHIGFQKFLEQMLAKIEQIVKGYKQDEKTFLSGIQKIEKEVASSSEKLGKQTVLQEKQIVKISQMLSSNFQSQQQNEKLGSFKQLMIEYQGLTETLKENYSNFKAFILYSLEQAQDLVKNFKHQQTMVLKAVSSVFVGLSGQEQNFVDLQQAIQRDFSGFVNIIDTQNLKNQFRCQLINKHQVEFIDSSTRLHEEEEEAEEVKQSKVQEETTVKANSQERGVQEVPQNEFQIVEDTPGGSSTSQTKSRIESLENTLPEQSQCLIQPPETVQQKHNHGSSLQRTESVIVKDDIQLDVKFASSVAGEKRFEAVNRSQAEIKAFKSVNGLTKKAGGSLISPLKKQLEKLTQQQTELVDEETQRDFDRIKFNMSQMMKNTSTLLQQQHMTYDEFEETLGGGTTTDKNGKTPNSKFIKDKFMGLMEGEKCLQTYSCAVSLKILIQGRLYVTNKRLCFHSYFNDKTIFGKETKIMIPFTNMARVEKKSNLVFPNSISIFTKEDKEIFITSFVYRDQAFELIQRSLNGNSNGNTDFASRSRSASAENVAMGAASGGENNNQIQDRMTMMMTGEVGGKENKNEYSQGFEEGHNPSEERDLSLEEQQEINDDRAALQEELPIFDNSSYSINEEFLRVEAERYEQIKTQNPSVLNYSFVGYDEILNCSLKHIFMVYINFNQQWTHLENLTLQSWLDKYPLTNIDLIYEPQGGLENVPDYFAKSEVQAPQPQYFAQWPLTLKARVSLTHLVEKPKFMQPKQNMCKIEIDNFLVSPRKIIRKFTYKLEGVPYADSFNFDYLLTLEQLEGGSPTAGFKTKIKSEFRVNIIKPIRLIQGTVVKETENSLRETYASGPFKENLFKKIIELQKHMKDRFEKENQTALMSSRGRSRERPVSQAQRQVSTKLQLTNGQGIDPQVLERNNDGMFASASSIQLHQSHPHESLKSQIDQTEFKHINKQLADMKDLIQKLLYTVIGLAFINVVLIGIVILR